MWKGSYVSGGHVEQGGQEFTRASITPMQECVSVQEETSVRWEQDPVQTFATACIIKIMRKHVFIWV